MEKLSEGFLQISFQLFGNLVRENRERFEWMREKLIKARLYIPLEIYVSVMLFSALLSFFLSASISLFFSPLLFLPIGVLASALALFSFYLYPVAKISSRSRNIDAMMFYAISYMLILAKSGLPPHQIIERIAENQNYGELSREMRYVVREMRIFGKDLITSLKNLAETTPSKRLREFSEGMALSDLSGGEYIDYLEAKAEQYMNENRQIQKEFLEFLSLLAEIYVTGFVAGPLFLIVILIVMGMISGGDVMMSLNLITYFLLPFMGSIFLIIIDISTPEVYK